MAEYAEEQLEEQLPELQELTVSGLLSSEEVTQLLRWRRGLEYRLQKREKRLRDLQAYAQHETCLLLLLKHRRRAAHYYFKRDRIEASIVQRLHRLHRQACYRFQHRVDCWLAHARFCEQIGHPQQASKVLARMLQVHSAREDLWLAAADWHWHERLEARARWLRRKAARGRKADDAEEAEKLPLGLDTAAAAAAALQPARHTAPAKDVLQSAQLARAFLLRGLRVHKRSPRLLTALFCLESELTAWVIDRRGDLPSAAGLDADSVASGEPAMLVLGSLLNTAAAESRDLLGRLADAAAACGPLAERALRDIQDRLAALPAPAVAAPETREEVEPAEDPEDAAVRSLETALAAGGLEGLRAAWDTERDSGRAGVRALRRYAELECGSSSSDSVSRVRREFERQAGSLGSGSVAFWTGYLQFEDELGDPALVGLLDWRARKFLRPELLNAFNVARLCPGLG